MMKSKTDEGNKAIEYLALAMSVSLHASQMKHKSLITSWLAMYHWSITGILVAEREAYR